MKLLTDVNQYVVGDVPRAKELQTDGINAVRMADGTYTSKDMQNLIDRIKGHDGDIVTIEGGIDYRQLLDEPNWTNAPRQINRNRQVCLDVNRKPTRCIVYYEWAIDINKQCTVLNKQELLRAWELEGKTPLLPLCREWYGDSKARSETALTMDDAKIKGICFELAANVQLIKNQNIVAGLKRVAARNKEMWILMSPYNGSTDYAGDMELVLKFLKPKLGPTLWGKLNFIVAVYELEIKHTSFFGEGNNTMLKALEVARRYR